MQNLFLPRLPGSRAIDGNAQHTAMMLFKTLVTSPSTKLLVAVTSGSMAYFMQQVGGVFYGRGGLWFQGGGWLAGGDRGRAWVAGGTAGACREGVPPHLILQDVLCGTGSAALGNDPFQPVSQLCSLLACRVHYMQVSKIPPHGISVLSHSFMADLPPKHERAALQKVLEARISRMGTQQRLLPSEKEREELLAASDNAAFLMQALNDFLYRPEGESMRTSLAYFMKDRVMQEVRSNMLAFSMGASNMPAIRATRCRPGHNAA